MSELIIPNDSNEAKVLSRRAKLGICRRVCHGVYTNNLNDRLEVLILREWKQLVSHLVPAGILSFRTALELSPARDPRSGMSFVFVTSTYSKTIELSGLVIKIIRGDTTNFTEQVLPSLYRTNLPRALLENLSHNRKRANVAKCLEPTAIEMILAKYMDTRGEQELNNLRNEARVIAEALNMEGEFSRLNTIISLLLSSHLTTGSLKTEFAKALVNREPCDDTRLKQFETLSIYLRKCIFCDRPYKYTTASWKSLAFFEAYFSNFIEGTEFLIDEAEDIIFAGKEIYNRHADSHDVLSLYQLVSDLPETSRVPKNSEEFLSQLKTRHSLLLGERPDKSPGSFKMMPNRAGNTVFVHPSHVVGTLMQAFDLYQTLPEGMPRALFMMFIISEIHPFEDGNGRIARVMMNGELVASEQYKCIITTVHRDNYLGGLRRASRDNIFQTFCKVIDQSQAYTESIDWDDFGEARIKLEKDGAAKTPDEGLALFNRALRQLALSAIAQG